MTTCCVCSWRAKLAPSWSSGKVLKQDRVPSLPPEPLCQGGNRSKDVCPGAGMARPLPPCSTASLPSSQALALGPAPALRGSAFPKGPGRGWGTASYPTHLCQPFCTRTRKGHSPPSGRALFGLTVTFLPELPARPTLAEVALPARAFQALSALPPTPHAEPPQRPKK